MSRLGLPRCFYISVIHHHFPLFLGISYGYELGLGVGIGLGIYFQTGMLFQDQK